MKKQKQRFKEYLLATIIFCVVFVTATTIRAGVSENLSGWSWGGSEDVNIAGSSGTIDGNETGAGWISMNSSNCDTNNDGKSEGVGSCPPAGTNIPNYGVNFPTEDGPITGYAWSSNLGYIDFAPHSGCPGSPKYAGACDAYPSAPDWDSRREESAITGWARIVDIAKESANNNSGGWKGWIKMSGTNYGVMVSGDSFSGSAWNGEEPGTGGNIANGLGWIDFSGVFRPSASLSANPPIINIKTNPNWETAGLDITLNWTVTGNTTCTKSSSNGAWTGTTNASGEQIINQKSSSVTYTLTCSGVTAKSVTVSTACYTQTCASQTCGNDVLKLGETNLNVCTSASSCSADADCQTRSVGDWKEVAP